MATHTLKDKNQKQKTQKQLRMQAQPHHLNTTSLDKLIQYPNTKKNQKDKGRINGHAHPKGQKTKA